MTHGTKRPADDDLEEQQRLSKRFNLLNLDRTGKLWIAPPSTVYHHQVSPLPQPQPAPPQSSTTTSQTNGPLRLEPQSPQTYPPHPTVHLQNNDNDDRMHLEDTKTTLYIHNLDAELASLADDSSITPPKPHLVFIPDIERHLNRIPPHLLQQNDAHGGVSGGGGGGGELVLYSVPSSLSVPVERDSVRRAILESRARVREKQELEQMGVTTAVGIGEKEDGIMQKQQHNINNELYEPMEDDGDAMDIG